MRKHWMMGVMAAGICSLAMQGFAAYGDASGGAAVSTDKRNASGDVSGSMDSKGNVGADVNGSAEGKSTKMEGTAQATAQASRMKNSASNSANKGVSSLRSEYRGFARRLNSVETKIKNAVREGRMTAEEAKQRREEVANIRARFKRSTDKAAAKMTDEEKEQMNADVKASEDAVEASSNASENQ